MLTSFSGARYTLLTKEIQSIPHPAARLDANPDTLFVSFLHSFFCTNVPSSPGLSHMEKSMGKVVRVTCWCQEWIVWLPSVTPIRVEDCVQIFLSFSSNCETERLIWCRHGNYSWNGIVYPPLEILFSFMVNKGGCTLITWKLQTKILIWFS